ncbi:MAG TPA: primosomal protein N', partial [Gammaproteobacteria bacterium]|nr:primosomal protein N' [Gammaproteobacteria bacterium]
DKKNKPTQNFYWEVSTLGKGIALETLNRAPKQKVLLQFLSEQNQATKQAMLDDKFVNWRPTMRALEKKAFVEKKNLVVPPLLPQRESAPKVNREQKAAIDKISNKINQFAIFLLDGITGSGKTEVYLNSIVNVINNDQQVLILIPEISLTPQLLQRFESRFGGGIATLHSGMNDSERYDIWLKAKNAQVNILIGTRSAIFTPMPKLGMIIIDEEHDLSYKQQTGLRYSARDIALTRAQRLKIPIVLGSATPSFESLLNVKRGIFQELRLSKRAGKSKPPIIKTLNIKGQKLQENFSVQLLQLIDKHLMRNEQVMIFLNRRGYAPTLICQECGWVGMCNRCDHPMTIHEYKQRIICHHCGSERRTPAQCPECSSIDLRPRGYGTERIEQVLRRFFPTTEILRIDRDTTSRKNALHQLLNKVKIDQAQILLGTQMLAKGHDFPNVTLVGILDTDQGLFGVDLRASERMAQLITQVAGRAGRGKKAGKVVIQTQHPDHPLLTSLIEQGYRQFAQTALQERKQARMPPYTYAALLRATSTAVKFNIQFLTDIKQTLLQLRSDDLEILGPAPSPMERMAGQYRTQLLLVSENRKSLHGALDYLLQRIDSFDSVKRVKWSLDIDPQEMS